LVQVVRQQHELVDVPGLEEVGATALTRTVARLNIS
jgi:hypothetical protein